MPGEVNIQSLFAQLRLEHLLVYLPANGWESAAGTQPDHVRFEMPTGNAPFVVTLPRSSATFQSRRMLQAAIYTLCDVEDRQPAEIIRDMLSAELPKKTPAADGGAVRLRFTNGNPRHPITVHIGSRPGESLLMPGEAVEIVAESSQDGLCEITIKTVGG